MDVTDWLSSETSTGIGKSTWMVAPLNTANRFNMAVFSCRHQVPTSPGSGSRVVALPAWGRESGCPALSERDAATSRASAPSPSEDVPRRLEPSVEEMLVSIRTRLGLNVTQLSEALRVERPTIYSWLRGAPQLRPPNRRRIRDVWELAEDWGSLCQQPLPDLDRQIVQGRTLLELLRAEHLRSFVLKQAFRTIAAERQTEQGSRRGRRGRDLANRLGRPELPDSDFALALETGQRAADE